MPKYTENYKLALPDEYEFYDINETNENTRKIDKVLKEQEDYVKEHGFTHEKVVESITRAASEGEGLNAASLAGKGVNDFMLATERPNYALKTDLTPKANRSELPKKLSEFENDPGYITAQSVPSISQSLTSASTTTTASSGALKKVYDKVNEHLSSTAPHTYIDEGDEMEFQGVRYVLAVENGKAGLKVVGV